MDKPSACGNVDGKVHLTKKEEYTEDDPEGRFTKMWRFQQQSNSGVMILERRKELLLWEHGDLEHAGGLQNLIERNKSVPYNGFCLERRMGKAQESYILYLREVEKGYI